MLDYLTWFFHKRKWGNLSPHPIFPDYKLINPFSIKRFSAVQMAIFT
jgi:hypothetical protein